MTDINNNDKLVAKSKTKFSDKSLDRSGPDSTTNREIIVNIRDAIVYIITEFNRGNGFFMKSNYIVCPCVLVLAKD